MSHYQWTNPHDNETLPFHIDDPQAPSPLTLPYPSFMRTAAFDSNINSSGHTASRPSSSLNPLQPPMDDVRDNREADCTLYAKSPNRTFRLRFLLILLVLIVAVGIALGVYFGTRSEESSDNHSASPSAASPTPSGQPNSKILYGGDGTIVTTEDGTTFVYNNSFGGYFVQDPNNPFNNDARGQSWSPPLNQSWQFGKDQILGVNLGGWLVLEPFITPALYQKYPGAIDEWTLHTLMTADTAGGGINQIEEHYKTFITEEDFAQIAGAGLNWIRLPIPFWAIDTWPGEPFLAKVSWKYALKAFEWARKYGIRIMLDIHTAPGSQNGYNHSGQSGKINILNGVMGVANAQRLLHYIRIFTEFISQPQYKDVIVMLGLVNEPLAPIDPTSSFYIEAHRMIRDITGVGAGNGPYISIQGGSPDLPTFNGSDRIALEQHPYFAFDGKGSLDVVPYIPAPCRAWGAMMNNSQKSFGVTTGGEFSLGFNDCGLMLRSVADEHVTKGCPQWDIWENYTSAQKDDLKSFAMSSMDALQVTQALVTYCANFIFLLTSCFQQWFFWTWKIGPSAKDNSPRSPLWSYKLGLDNGWIPKNPRDSIGYCASLGVPQDAPFDGTYEAYQTGGPGASGSIDPDDLSKYPWPPGSIGLVNDAGLLPTYTATWPMLTLPTQSFPAPTSGATAVDGGDGWFNNGDTAMGIVTVAGCQYPNAWDATAAPVPTALCTGTPARKREPVPFTPV